MAERPANGGPFTWAGSLRAPDFGKYQLLPVNRRPVTFTLAAIAPGRSGNFRMIRPPEGENEAFQTALGIGFGPARNNILMRGGIR